MSFKELTFKWSGKEFSLPIEDTETISSLKHKIEEQTRVQPKRQKLLGLKAKTGKLPSDDALLSDLVLKPGQKVLLMGAPEDIIEAGNKQADSAPAIQDDFQDVDEETLKEAASKNWEADQEKIRKRLRNVEVPVLNAPRSGKKCLVLDIDYTIFDLGSSAERPEELARPYLLEMLTAVYPHYDIIIWSANSMKWIEIKMRELRVSNHPDFKVTCFLDGRCMVPVKTEKYGWEHQDTLSSDRELLYYNAKVVSTDLYNERGTVIRKHWSRELLARKGRSMLESWRRTILCLMGGHDESAAECKEALCGAGIFNCKPLSFLWGKFPEFYRAANTIMFDDLRRNFVYNKQNGLVIRPFKNAHTARGTDRELLHLKAYLLKIAALDSLSALRHSRWEAYIQAELRELNACEREGSPPPPP